MSSEPAARSPGRPPRTSGDRVRQQLLEAARARFLTHEFKAVTLRSLATQAGVNPAMINYYFGSKQGLYLAMVDQMLVNMEDSLAGFQPGADDPIAAFVTAYMQLLADNPWWPIFIVREVLFGKEQFRRQIVERINRSMAQDLIAVMAASVAIRKFRSDLNPALAAWSLMGMMVFPFLSSPLAETLVQTRASRENVGLLIDHTRKLFFHGVISREVGS